MATQTQEFCEAEERKIFASKKMIVHKKNFSSKFDRFAKYIYYVEIGVNYYYYCLLSI
jgi:hypothetical protein